METEMTFLSLNQLPIFYIIAAQNIHTAKLYETIKHRVENNQE